MFFSLYNLKDTVDTVVKEALKKGYIATQLGNKRMIVDGSDTSWIANHYIQGTSSLIFKQALMNVMSAYSDKVELVLPVHDAALFKVHKDIETDMIIAQFKDAFVKWIPNSKPVIKVKDFFEEDK
jgi:DNA polymerase I-like protein with 3'-5' exonuclease and polymerase domains